MNYWQLYIFYLVVEKKSFSQAAVTAHISQPTVSSHIKELESKYGCRLIDRLDKRVEPTPAGKILFEKTKQLIALKEKTDASMAAFQGKVIGPLLIGGSNIPGEYLLPEIIATYQKVFPAVYISLSIRDSQGVIDSIINNEIELGVVGVQYKHPKIKQLKLLDDELKLIIPGDHKWANRKSVNIKQLHNEPLLFRQKGSGTLNAIYENLGHFSKEKITLNIVAELGSTNAVIRGILNNMGISILSPLSVSDHLESGLLKSLSIKGVGMQRGFYLTTHKNHTLSPAASKFIEHLQKIYF